MTEHRSQPAGRPAGESRRFSRPAFDLERDYHRLHRQVRRIVRSKWSISPEDFDFHFNGACFALWHGEREGRIRVQGDVASYLATTVIRSIQRERRRDRDRRLEDEGSLAAASDVMSDLDLVDDEIERRRRRELCRQIVRHRLSGREREAFSLRWWAELPAKEAAARLGISVKKYEAALTAANKKLQAELRAVADGDWCESTKATSLMTGYLHGIHVPGTRAHEEIQQHLAACLPCRHMVARFRGIAILLPPPVALVGSAGLLGPLVDRLRDAVDRAPGGAHDGGVSGAAAAGAATAASSTTGGASAAGQLAGLAMTAKGAAVVAGAVVAALAPLIVGDGNRENERRTKRRPEVAAAGPQLAPVAPRPLDDRVVFGRTARRPALVRAPVERRAARRERDRVAESSPSPTPAQREFDPVSTGATGGSPAAAEFAGPAPAQTSSSEHEFAPPAQAPAEFGDDAGATNSGSEFETGR